MKQKSATIQLIKTTKKLNKSGQHEIYQILNFTTFRQKLIEEKK